MYSQYELFRKKPVSEYVHIIPHSGPTMSGNEKHRTSFFFQNTERTYHCIIMHIFKKEKQSIIKLNKQSINLT